MTEQELQEIKADVNYSVSQLLAHIGSLQQEVDYLKRQNRILKGEHEDE